MSRVKMRYSHRPDDAALMAQIRDDLAELMGHVLDCDSTRHAPIYAAWAAADACARALAAPADPRAETTDEERLARGAPVAADVARLAELHRRVQAMGDLLHPRAAMAAPILAVALTIREAAVAWTGNAWLWRERRGV